MAWGGRLLGALQAASGGRAGPAGPRLGVVRFVAPPRGLMPHAWVGLWRVPGVPPRPGLRGPRGGGHGAGRQGVRTPCRPRRSAWLPWPGSRGRGASARSVASQPGGVLVPLATPWGVCTRRGGVRGTQAGGRHGEVRRHVKSGGLASGGGNPRRHTRSSRPLTKQWSRRQQPSLLRRCGWWRGSPRALGFRFRSQARRPCSQTRRGG